LRRLNAWSASLDAGVVLINPLHASSPTYPQEASPYFAGSRCFANPLYIAVEEVPGAKASVNLPSLAAAGRALNRDRIIDRDRIWRLKSAALETVFATFAGDLGFDRYVGERGLALERFATYCALAEVHGSAWRNWPAALRDPERSEVQDFARSPTGAFRIRYYSWLQWILDDQLSAAARPAGVVEDLAVGVDPDGADAWVWQETFAEGMTIGAPPDEFATRGQDWSLAAPNPWKLRSSGYQPWIEAVQAGFRHGAGLRVDHVMGLFRLYWIPGGATPANGAYVHYPHEDLLNILALEADRAGAFVVGEALGTVANEVRTHLADRQVLTYRVWWFESDRTAAWPARALGAVTTHDLPTVAGVMTGSDTEAQRRLGMEPNEAASAGLLRKLLDWTESDENSDVGEVTRRVYADLAQAPCAILTASLDDALGAAERPNMPGTVEGWPNWSLALPASLEEIEENPLAQQIASFLARP
jgi:4-alpha-glucanotransferase